MRIPQSIFLWLRSDCDEINISPQTVGSAPIQIMPDGTGFKGSGVDGQARKGDLKVVIGISPTGKNRNVRLYQKMAQMGIDFATGIFNG